MDLSLVPYVESATTMKLNAGESRYRECLKNHAAAMGGQAYDGCGEFMAGEEEALKCAACGCHRNFHRREGSPRPHSTLPMLPSPTPVAFFPPPSLPFHQNTPLPPPERVGSETPPRRQELQGPMRKRCRTKFTVEQKEKMRSFAEKLGWRIQKHNIEVLEEFCVEIGVDRHVLKVWMHNHKNSLSSSAAVSAVSGERGAAGPPTIRV